MQYFTCMFDISTFWSLTCFSRLDARWYKEQDFESKLPPYYRDRIVELHLATLAYINPRYSRVRIILTKIYTIQIILDDTCDRYASLREVESLAATIERYIPYQISWSPH